MAAEAPPAAPAGDDEVDHGLLPEQVGDVKSVFAQHVSSLTLGKPHPADISESALLSSQRLPPLHYPHDVFDRDIIDEGRLSSLQLESVLYAGQRHLTILPGGKRGGMYIADGAGVGKGRQIAGIILDAFARGQKKHIWFSIAPDLRLDAERDLKDVGCHIGVIDGCRALDASSSKGLGSSAATQCGVLFTTYTMLASSRGKDRLQQLVDWCGSESFAGCIVFDEAHRAKNFDSSANKDGAGGDKEADNEEDREDGAAAGGGDDAPSESARKKKEPKDNSTKVSKAVLALQERLPLARVVYCSATGVTDVSNLAYCGRLGLWGGSTAFPDFLSFRRSLETRGLGALEMLALELKASGAYVSRGLSWQGAEFEQVECPLSPEFAAMYDGAVAFWRDLRRRLEEAAAATGASGMCKKEHCAVGHGHVCNPLRPFWGVQQRFFRELCTAAKVNSVVAQAKEAVSAGRSVVVGLQSTSESGLDKHLEETGYRVGDRAAALICAQRYSVKAFIESYFPTTTRPRKLDVMTDGQLRCSLAVRAQEEAATGAPWDGAAATAAEAELRQAQASQRAAAAVAVWPTLVSACVVAKNRCLAALEALPLPPSPLDDLIDRLGGPGEVAEMTGRTRRVVRDRAGHLRYESRHTCCGGGSGSGGASAAESSLNIQERKLFMSGKKLVAIISDAASTGISLHAAVGSPAADRRRVHICLELAWSSDKTVQQLGRSHRSHQVTAPVFRLLMTPIGGERRFAAAVSKRLMSLGALTRGDRRAATGGDMFGAFDLDNKLGRTALRSMYLAVEKGAGLARGADIDSLWRCLHPELTRAAPPAATTAETAGTVEVKAASGAAWSQAGVRSDGSGSPVPDGAVAMEGAETTAGEPAAVAEAAAAAVAAGAAGTVMAVVVDGDSKGGGSAAVVATAVASPAATVPSGGYTPASTPTSTAAAAATAAFTTPAADALPTLTPAMTSASPAAGAAAAARAWAVAAATPGVAGPSEEDKLQEVLAAAADTVVDMGIKTDEPDVRVFLSRMLGQPVARQNLLLLYMTSCLASLIRDARAAGMFDEGVADLAAASVTVEGEPEEIARDPVTGVPTMLATILLDRGIAFANARAKRDEALAALATNGVCDGAGTGFYRSHNLVAGRRLYLLAVARADNPRLFVLTRPSTGASPVEMERGELLDKYIAVSDDAAEGPWEAAYAETDNDERGSRKVRIGLLSGAVLPLWSALSATMTQNATSFTKAEQAMKVYRVCLDNGRKLVGIRLPHGVSAALRANVAKLKAVRQQEGAAAKTVIEAPVPIDLKALKAARTAPKTILSFFGAPKVAAAAGDGRNGVGNEENRGGGSAGFGGGGGGGGSGGSSFGGFGANAGGSSKGGSSGGSSKGGGGSSKGGGGSGKGGGSSKGGAAKKDSGRAGDKRSAAPIPAAFRPATAAPAAAAAGLSSNGGGGGGGGASAAGKRVRASDAGEGPAAKRKAWTPPGEPIEIDDD